jgi:lipopolysaccharide export system protein LptC
MNKVTPKLIQAIKCRQTDELIDVTRQLIETVRCDRCYKLHEVKSETFVTIYGNICVGTGGGIVGNNFDKEGNLERVSVYCKFPCFKEVAGSVLE